MRRLPIRLRLTLVFAATAAIVLAGFGWFVYARVGRDLARDLDQSLRSRAQDVAALVHRGGSLRSTRGGLIERGESFAELLTLDGHVVDATSPIDDALVTRPQLRRARTRPVFADRDAVPGLDEPARMLAVGVDTAGARRVLVVGATRENGAETLASLRSWLLIAGPLVLALMSVAAYLVAGAALAPIEAMRRRAAEISSASLAERLPAPPTDDEVGRLGATLNAMLARIEEGVRRERDFVADASHELRTPLALLKSELELALRPRRNLAELQRALRSASAEGDRVARIADDLLLLARAEDGGLPLRLEPTDVDELLESVARRFRGRAEAAGRRVTVDADDAPVVEADRLRVEQALGNLVDNALRHGAGAVTLRSCSSPETVELHVVDDGPGFDEDFLPRAFERFARADRPRTRDGSGLGLAIVETVARAHGGSAAAANAAAGGADVWISLNRRAPRSGALQ